MLIEYTSVGVASIRRASMLAVSPLGAGWGSGGDTDSQTLTVTLPRRRARK